MVKNVVSFILSFVILMVKMWIFMFFPGRVRRNRVIQCSPLSAQCLMKDEHSWEALDQTILPQRVMLLWLPFGITKFQRVGITQPSAWFRVEDCYQGALDILQRIFLYIQRLTCKQGYNCATLLVESISLQQKKSIKQPL